MPIFLIEAGANSTSGTWRSDCGGAVTSPSPTAPFSGRRGRAARLGSASHRRPDAPHRSSRCHSRTTSFRRRRRLPALSAGAGGVRVPRLGSVARDSARSRVRASLRGDQPTDPGTAGDVRHPARKNCSHPKFRRSRALSSAARCEPGREAGAGLWQCMALSSWAAELHAKLTRLKVSFRRRVRTQNPGRNPAEKRAAVMCRSRQSALGIQPEENQ
jgi:hypothetical protein